LHLVDTAGATELKGIIASLDFLVGARYHSVVAAAASATPFLAVGWAHKYSELATEAGVPYAYIDGRTSSIENVLSAVRVGWDRRDETRTLLDLGRSSLEASARRAFEVMFETWNATERPD
jgi:colanic acid/amylovoran biosynthesis protein